MIMDDPQLFRIVGLTGRFSDVQSLEDRPHDSRMSRFDILGTILSLAGDWSNKAVTGEQ
jgi:hypothetical protein